MLAYYRKNFKFVFEPGTIKVMIGSSSEDIRLESAFDINGEGKQVVKERVFLCPVHVK